MNILDDHIKDISSIEDVVILPTLNEEIILKVLKARYDKLNIYTSTGNVLLAINPFENVPLYSPEYFKLYCNATIDSIVTLPPHPWKTATRAYLQMLGFIRTNSLNKIHKINQSILISGESGSGKTETTKIIISYLTERSHNVKRKHDESYKRLEQIKENVQLSNPILEALGNARTCRNDNSSRFGKYIKLYFDDSGILQGAGMDTFLLETTRVVHQSKNERNFHIFYMLCSDNNIYYRNIYKIDNIENYMYLSESQCYHRNDGISDLQQLNTFRQSMKVLGVNDSDMNGLFKTLIAILNIGNLKFSSDTSTSGTVITVITSDTEPYAEIAASLLGIKVIDLVEALTTRKMTVRNESYRVTMTASQAEDTRNIFAKTLYFAVFMWTLTILNNKMKSVDDSDEEYSVNSKISAYTPLSQSSFRATFLSTGKESELDDFDVDSQSPTPNSPQHGVFGLLDIFGFENMESGNFLEQLLINYANESLQQQFDDQMIQAEQELYVNQGIDWTFITFPKSECLETIAGRRNSVLTLLDEACIAPSGSDNSFINSLYSVLGQNPYISVNAKIKARQEFGIKHYAGVVNYSSNGIVVKNTNRIFPLNSALDMSSDAYVVRLGTYVPNIPIADGLLKRRTSKMVEGSISNSFKDNVFKLLDTINKTESHYIKCIKPNHLNVSNNFISEMVENQLKSGGILQTIKVIRSGFPVRLTHIQFQERYNSLFTILINNNSGNKNTTSSSNKQKGLSLKERIAMAMKILNESAKNNDSVIQQHSTNSIDEDSLQLNIQCGKDYVFLQQNAFLTLEKLYCFNAYNYVVRIQARYRCYIQHKYYITMCLSIKIILRHWRNYHIRIKRTTAANILQRFYRFIVQPYIYTRRKSSITISKNLRMLIKRRYYLYILWACSILQRFRFHPNVKRVIARKNLMIKLFSPIIWKLQRIWKIKYEIYKNQIAILKGKKNEELFSTHVYRPRKSGLNFVDETKAEMINGKSLLHSNSSILWTIFCFYCKNKADIPNANVSTNKRNNKGLLSTDDIVTLLREWSVVPRITTMHKVKAITTRILSNSISKLITFTHFCKILAHIAVDSQVERNVRIMQTSSEQLPEDNPLYGRGLLLLFNVMDRSEGRSKFAQKRNTILIPSFIGIGGSASLHVPVTNVVPPSNNDTLNQTARTQNHDTTRFRTVEMSPEVRQLMRKNESSLISLALRYSTQVDIPPSETDFNMSQYDLHYENGNGSPYHRSPSHHSLNQYSPPVEKSPFSPKKDKRKASVLVNSNNFWRMMNDFGVSPDLCSKSVLTSLYDSVASAASSNGVNTSNGLTYPEFIELLDQVAQNCKTSGSDIRTPESRVRSMFQVMNMSEGREKLARHDRNATVIPPLIGLDKCEPKLR